MCEMIVNDCQRCSNYIFILDLTPGFIGLGKDNRKTLRRETFKYWDLVRLISEIWQYIFCDLYNNSACEEITIQMKSYVEKLVDPLPRK